LRAVRSRILCVYVCVRSEPLFSLYVSLSHSQDHQGVERARERERSRDIMQRARESRERECTERERERAGRDVKEHKEKRVFWGSPMPVSKRSRQGAMPGIGAVGSSRYVAVCVWR
jgi:hypothetical protein